MASHKMIFLEIVFALLTSCIAFYVNGDKAKFAPGDFNLVGTVGSKSFYIQKGNVSLKALLHQYQKCV